VSRLEFRRFPAQTRHFTDKKILQILPSPAMMKKTAARLQGRLKTKTNLILPYDKEVIEYVDPAFSP